MQKFAHDVVSVEHSYNRKALTAYKKPVLSKIVMHKMTVKR